MRLASSTYQTTFLLSAMLLSLTVEGIADSNITYFDGKQNSSMSVISSTFAPTHPECCTPKAPIEPFVIPEQKVVPSPPPVPEPVIQKEIDSDGDSIVDSVDECPNTPKGYKVDTKGCPKSVTLHLNFASDSSTLPASADADVLALTNFMNENPAATITIIGHTDSSGQATKNQILSENRAKALSSRLTQNGIASERIKVSGKGLSEPVASNKKPAGRSLNRRIEISIK